MDLGVLGLLVMTGFRKHTLADSPDLFWKKVRQGSLDECWPWLGAKDREGYGKVQQRGQTTQLRAHRLALQFSGVAVPEHLGVLHSCDNPPCCNPNHLRVGTQKENAHDRVVRQRHTPCRGEASPNAKLTSEQVREIRRALSAGTHRLDLAATYGVTKENIRAIDRRQTWAHI